MKQICLIMAVAMLLSGSGLVTNAYASVMQPTPINNVEAQELDISQDLAGPGIANVRGGGDSDANVLAGVGVVALILIFIGVIAAANEEDGS